jgi:hypothetical protein
MAGHRWAAAKHWSKVAAGEEFTLVLDYDAAKYTVSQVEVRMRRNPSSGLTESAEARWSWAVANGYGEGEAKAKAAARASGMFTPALMRSGEMGKESTSAFRSFFASTQPAQAAAAGAAGSSSSSTSAPQSDVFAAGADRPAVDASTAPRGTPGWPSAEGTASVNDAFEPAADALPAMVEAAVAEMLLSSGAAAELQRTPAVLIGQALREAGLGMEAISRVRDCPGVKLDLPNDLPPSLNYPHAKHAREAKGLAWTSPSADGVVFSIASPGCRVQQYASRDSPPLPGTPLAPPPSLSTPTPPQVPLHAALPTLRGRGWRRGGCSVHGL